MFCSKSILCEWGLLAGMCTHIGWQPQGLKEPFSSSFSSRQAVLTIFLKSGHSFPSRNKRKVHRVLQGTDFNVQKPQVPLLLLACRSFLFSVYVFLWQKRKALGKKNSKRKTLWAFFLMSFTAFLSVFLLVSVPDWCAALLFLDHSLPTLSCLQTMDALQCMAKNKNKNQSCDC